MKWQKRKGERNWTDATLSWKENKMNGSIVNEQF